MAIARAVDGRPLQDELASKRLSGLGRAVADVLNNNVDECVYLGVNLLSGRTM